jgi:hypothetical protein
MAAERLGKLESVHGVAPAYLQRAAIVCLLSFVFFLAMMFGFYIRQNIGYFLLATAFLLVNVLTLIGWMFLRRSLVSIHEHGIAFRKFRLRWDEIAGVERPAGRRGLEITRKNGERLILPETIDQLDRIEIRIRHEQALAAGRSRT